MIDIHIALSWAIVGRCAASFFAAWFFMGALVLGNFDTKIGCWYDAMVVLMLAGVLTAIWL